MHKLLGYTRDGDEITIPSRWEICDNCRGDGHHSQHFGDFSAEWVYESQGPDAEEWIADYVAGRFDIRCEECDGTGKVLVADEDALTPEQAEAWQESLNYEEERRHEKWLRERGIEY